MTLTTLEQAKLIHTLEGLLDIAELAMPDTYFHSDSRVKRAQSLLKKLKGMS